MYSKEDVLNFVEEYDVKFIRLTYFDVFGIQKNVSILPARLNAAFEKGIAIDATAIQGFSNPDSTDLFLKPDPSTFAIMPWRSLDGNVIFMICDIYYPDGRIYPLDSRYILKQAIQKARAVGIEPEMAAKFEFYLFLLDEKGQETHIPLDQAGYMDVAPLDRGENVRRDICLTLNEMGLQPLKSFHQKGPGQNEIDFHFAPALRAADEASIFKWVVKTAASLAGMWTDFSPRPLKDQPGNGLHIQIRFFDYDPEIQAHFAAGILKYCRESTLFFNPAEASYKRFGKFDAPEKTDWSRTSRFTLLRFPPLNPETMEIRSTDCLTNPYLSFALILEAGLKGVEEKLDLQDAASAALLPRTRGEAASLAKASAFIQQVLPAEIVQAYLGSDRS